MLDVGVLFDNNKCEIELDDKQLADLFQLLNTNANVIKGPKYSLMEIEGQMLCTNGNLNLKVAPKALEKLFEQIALIVQNHIISLDIYDVELKKGKTIKYANGTNSSYEYEG